jgi:hypothetical protein
MPSHLVSPRESGLNAPDHGRFPSNPRSAVLRYPPLSFAEFVDDAQTDAEVILVIVHAVGKVC